MGACSSTAKNDSNATAAATPVGAASNGLIKLLGESLVTKNGNNSTADVLAGKSCIGLYFSAHWCPPCRGFTPKLADAYTKHLQAKGVEIVFVSSDRDQAAFNDYYNSMPWLALPFGARALKQSLGQKYRVSGIPSLILLKPDGSLLTADGRAKVAADPTGKQWLPSAPTVASAAVTKKVTVAAAASTTTTTGGGLEAILGSAPLLAPDGHTRVSLADVVQGAPLIALYFSAHWCGPCQTFTPKLITFVEMLAEEGVHLPVLFGSSDSDQKGFDAYFGEMPWHAFPYGDERIGALKSRYDVSGIPWLVVLDTATGRLVVNEADTDVPQGPQAFEKWLKLVKPVAAAPAA